MTDQREAIAQALKAKRYEVGNIFLTPAQANDAVLELFDAAIEAAEQRGYERGKAEAHKDSMRAAELAILYYRVSITHGLSPDDAERKALAQTKRTLESSDREDAAVSAYPDNAQESPNV